MTYNKYKFIIYFISIICFLSINVYADENRVINGDFETGDLSNWSYISANNVVLNPIYSGESSVNIYSLGYIEQTVDLSDVDFLTFWYLLDKGYLSIQINDSYSSYYKQVFYTDTNITEWKYKSIDVSKYTGNCSIKFFGKSLSTGVNIYIDDIYATHYNSYNFTNVPFDITNTSYVYWSNSELIILLLIIITLSQIIQLTFTVLRYLME